MRLLSVLHCFFILLPEWSIQPHHRILSKAYLTGLKNSKWLLSPDFMTRIILKIIQTSEICQQTFKAFSHENYSYSNRFLPDFCFCNPICIGAEQKDKCKNHFISRIRYAPLCNWCSNGCYWTVRTEKWFIRSFNWIKKRWTRRLSNRSNPIYRNLLTS